MERADDQKHVFDKGPHPYKENFLKMIINAFLKRIVPTSVMLVPLFVFAQIIPLATTPGRTIWDIFADAQDFLNDIIVFFMLLATVIFLWGIIKYITAGGDEERLNEARNMILWGIIFLAVMVAVWGLVYVVLRFVLLNTGSPTIPDGPTQHCIPTPGNPC